MTITEQERVTLDSALRERGIASAAKALGWQPARVAGNLGWAYPVFSADGSPYPDVKRFKAFNPEKGPKYLWWPRKPEKVKYYFKPGLQTAIAAAGGWLYLAGGEPDLVAYISAGFDNALTWLDGEGAPPATLASDLAFLGVKNVIYAPDRDTAGLRSAAKVQALLDGSGIGLYLYALPYEMGSKKDTNDLWIDCGGERAAFEEKLALCGEIDPVELHLYTKQEGAGQEVTRQVSARVDDWRSAWINKIIEALGTPAMTQGRIARWRCPLPHHEDRDPSFRISNDQNSAFPWPMCSCDIQSKKDAWDRVADALGVQPWAEFKAERAAETGYKPAAKRTPLGSAPNEAPTLPSKAPARYVSLKDQLGQLAGVLTGETKSELTPIKFPLPVLHEFGGFALYAWTGKMVAVTGVSGGGKTILLEMMALALMAEGYDVIWWGPEWTPFEYALRNLQRAGGMAIDRVNELLVWYDLAARGVPVEDRGVPAPPQAAIDHSLTILKTLGKITGDMLFIPDMDRPIPQLIEDVRTITKARRAEGRKVAALFVDYVQLLKAPGKRDWDWAERATAQLKSVCHPRDCDLIGFCSSQARKDDSQNARSGNVLTQASAQGLSDHQFNLYITMTPDFNEDGTMGKFATIGLVKNSMGRLGRKRVMTDFARLSISPAKVENVNVDGAIEAALNSEHRNGHNGAQSEEIPF